MSTDKPMWKKDRKQKSRADATIGIRTSSGGKTSISSQQYHLRPKIDHSHMQCDEIRATA